jgi:hypothetical protein
MPREQQLPAIERARREEQRHTWKRVQLYLQGTPAAMAPKGILDLTQSKSRPSPEAAAGFDDFGARLRLQKTTNPRESHVKL